MGVNMIRFIISMMALSLAGSLSFAEDKEILRNCYSSPSRAQFFVDELEDIESEGDTAVLVLNEKMQVAGVISVSPERSEETRRVSKVTVNMMTLCSPLQVDTFYYADDLAENLWDWVKGEVEITQGEGKIVLKSEVVEKEDYATLIGVDFQAYDVFEDAGEDGWGLPKGKGRFYFYIPKNWK